MSHYRRGNFIPCPFTFYLINPFYSQSVLYNPRPGTEPSYFILLILYLEFVTKVKLSCDTDIFLLYVLY